MDSDETNVEIVLPGDYFYAENMNILKGTISIIGHDCQIEDNRMSHSEEVVVLQFENSKGEKFSVCMNRQSPLVMALINTDVSAQILRAASG